jgi:hypothetical protein
MLDLREHTFIDSSAVDVILDAAVRARRAGTGVTAPFPRCGHVTRLPHSY